MASTLEASSPTLPASEDPPLDLDDLDATIFLKDAEALLVEQLHPFSPNSTSDDQDMEELTCHNKTSKPRRAIEINRRQIYRRREKREREELRRQVVDLEEVVISLRRVKEAEEAQFNAAQTPSFWFWKSVATRQRHERSLAEEEQRALAMSTRAQATYIRTLTNVVRTQEDAFLVQSEQDEAVRNVVTQSWESETEFFDALIQDLDTNCAPADELFQTCSSTAPLQVRKPDGTGVHTGHQCGYQDYKRCVDVRDPENTNARTYRNIITLENGVKVAVRNRLVTRRYDKERVSAWKLVCEGEGVHNGFQFDETASEAVGIWNCDRDVHSTDANALYQRNATQCTCYWTRQGTTFLPRCKVSSSTMS